MQSILSGLMIFVCVRIATIYEQMVGLNYNDAKRRANILVCCLWIFAVTMRLVVYCVERFA